MKNAVLHKPLISFFTLLSMFLVKMSEEKLINTKKNAIDAVIWKAEKQFITSYLTGCLTRT